MDLKQELDLTQAVARWISESHGQRDLALIAVGAALGTAIVTKHAPTAAQAEGICRAVLSALDDFGVNAEEALALAKATIASLMVLEAEKEP